MRVMDNTWVRSFLILWTRRELHIAPSQEPEPTRRACSTSKSTRFYATPHELVRSSRKLLARRNTLKLSRTSLSARIVAESTPPRHLNMSLNGTLSNTCAKECNFGQGRFRVAVTMAKLMSEVEMESLAGKWNSPPDGQHSRSTTK